MLKCRPYAYCVGRSEIIFAEKFYDLVYACYLVIFV